MRFPPFRCWVWAQLMDGQVAALRHWARGRARVAGADHGTGRANGRKVEARPSS